MKGRRAILDEARRKVERSLMLAEAAESLATSAQKVVESKGKEGIDDLVRALTNYRRLRDAS